MSLCTLYRHTADHTKAKRYLELAKDRVTDKAILLTFYQESANTLTLEKKFHQALDSTKKALEIARQLYRDDDYGLFECQINLAESYEKTGDIEKAQQTFDDCFNAMDGRDDKSQGRTMSIKSRISRALTIKSKTSTVVKYRKASEKSDPHKSSRVDEKSGRADAMQRVAITLRQK